MSDSTSTSSATPDWNQIAQLWLDQPVTATDDPQAIRTRVREQGRRMSLALVGEYAVGLLFVCIAAWKLATDKGPDTFVWGFAVLWFTAMALQFTSENRRGLWVPSAESTRDYVMLALARLDRRERALRFTWILYGLQCVFLLAWLPATWFLWPEQAWALIERLPLMIGLLALITTGLVAWTISARTAIRNERVEYHRLRDELAASA
jgi:hypothetical protein